MAQNLLYNLLVALRDQLRTNISGSGDYNYDLVDGQVQLGFKSPDQAPYDTYICIAGASENMSNITLDNDAEINVEIEIYGYIRNKSGDVAMEDALKLLSDILNAVQADLEVGNRIGGVRVTTEVGSDDDLRLGICSVTISAKYWTP